MNNRTEPKVSIITACRNNVFTIGATIQGVVTQSYKNTEYIIIDANSTDGTFEVIQSYEDKVDIWIREADQGIADAWNKGIRKASGEIIGIINADDFYLGEAIEKAVSALQTAKDSGFVFGDLQYVDDSWKVLFKQIGDPNYARQISYEMPSIPHPTVFIRKEVYDRYGLFDVSYKAAMDYEFLLRLHKSGVTGKYLEQTLAAMRLGGESDINFVRAYKEVARASVQYGYSPVLANVRLIFKTAKSYLRRQLENWGLKQATKIYRTLFSKRYKL